MREVIKKGKSTSVVIEDFMKKNNLELNDFKFEVIEEGSKGFLGLFGQKPTTIKFILPDSSDKLREYIEGLLKRMNVKYKKLNINSKQDTHNIDIIGADNAGFLIGKEGKMLDSIQDIITQMINKYEKRKNIVIIDVDKYRKRRKDALIGKVKSLSSKVKKGGKSVTMKPLKASKRKLVHKLVKNDASIKTKTVGEGRKKRVVILPSENKKTARHANRKN